MSATMSGASGVPALAGTNTLHTLLGRGVVRIAVGGRIRAGIKVLTRKAEENETARHLYAEGLAGGNAFEAIERQITKAVPELANPLVPKNVPYFTVRGADFPNPQVARQIMNTYAEDRGDGVMRLYRFPVVFPSDAWQHVMPHEMVAWAANERRYWSEYAADGQTRYCMTHEPVPVDASGRRAIRIFGGRKKMLRPDNGGVCNPEACAEYQARKCGLAGRFVFFIPGIQSISAIDLPTNSFYAMQAAIEKFQTIGFMRGGRISGFLDGRGTPFWISKRLAEVSRIDDEGRASRVAQWLIELEAPIDVTALLRADDDLEAIEVRAGQAVEMLQGPRARDGGIDPPEPDVSTSPRSRASPEPFSRHEASDRLGRSTHAAKDARAARGENAASTPSGARVNASPAEAQAIIETAASLGVEAERFEAYAEKRWGKGWKVAAGGRKRALEDVTAFAGDAAGYREKITAELEVWS